MTTSLNNPNSKGGRLSLTAKVKGALLGAAAGDALGWPQEMKKRSGAEAQHPGFNFKGWSRRTGSRFYSHIEMIDPGEYSDDTQLILSTFRSLRWPSEWWLHLAEVELPAWLTYERGGGRATKRAAESWGKHVPPWMMAQQDRRQYYDAGGNGVAMRILPHCVLAAHDENFSKAAEQIIVNGVLTHGHPRALVGALAYGYVLWCALRSQETLPYGSLIFQTLSAVQEWAPLRDIAKYFPDWARAADSSNMGHYMAQWDRAVQEQVELLETAAVAIKRGALSLEEKALEDIGCFDARVGAAGTRSAAAATFLASRFAADPISGLIVAAHATGTDTDTIASMAGGVLGALAGQEWLGSHVQQIQDAHYLAALVDSFITLKDSPLPVRAESSTRKQDIIILLEKKEPGDSVWLPDGRQAELIKRIDHETASQKTIAVSWKLKCDDGQTVYIKRLGKRRETSSLGRGQQDLFDKSAVHTPPIPLRVGVKMYVQDLPRVRDFYENALGLEVRKQSGEYVNYAGILALIALPVRGVHADSIRPFSKQGQTIVYLETKDIQTVFQVIKKRKAIVVTVLRDEGSQSCFRCLDPAGNLVEVYQALPSNKS